MPLDASESRPADSLLFRLPGLGFLKSALRRGSMLRNSAHFANKLAKSCTAPYWVVAYELRVRGCQRRQAALVGEYLATRGAKKLQLGCGKVLLDGWLNTDIRQDISGVCYLDATTRFPIADRMFDYVFSEHIIEHLPYKGGETMMRESYRVLKPGGKVRVATPDLKKLLDLYTSKPSEAQQRYIRWSVDKHLPDVGIYKPQFVINNFFGSWGHRFIYDVPTLSALLTSAGFIDITQHAPGESDDANFCGVESHQREIGDEMNRMETMVLEARRPA